MKPTDRQLLEWFEYLNNSKAIYVWGANSEKITRKLMDKLYSWFASKTYDRAYYDNKLKEGEGKIGADCSGSFYPISGFDTTASGYYGKCGVKGYIGKLPRHKVCQVFKKNLSGKITHIGLYDGDGYTIEMKSSKDNVHKEKLNLLRWTYYGMPDWITYECPYEEPTETVKLGSKGVSVKWVQWQLREAGHNLNIDGSFGKKTDKSLRDFQKKHKLEVDGKCGRLTRSELVK